MKSINLKQFAKLSKALHQEQATLQARLNEINAVLGVSQSPLPISQGGETPFFKIAQKRGMSAEGRARIIAAQKARWAKFKAEKGPAPKKKTKWTMSPESKAKISAAQKKRWEKFHAKTGK